MSVRHSVPVLFLVLASASLATRAWAAPPTDPLSDLRREVADMRREISDMRREMYALRLDLLAAIGQAGGNSNNSSGSGRREAPPPPPPPPPAPGLPDDEPPSRGDDSGTGKVTGTVRLAEGNGPAWVYVENVPKKMVRGKTIEIKQVKKQFEPRAAVIQLGTQITFPNMDSTYHNVFSTSPGNTFDLGIYRAGDDPKSFTMTNPGVVDIYCNMHSEMSAAVLVVPSPIYVQVGKDGRFSLDNVPSGNRKIVAWSPGHMPSVQAVVVRGGKDVPATFTLSETSKGHTNKNGQPYGSYK